MAKNSKKTTFGIQGRLLECLVHASGRVKAVRIEEDLAGIQEIKLSKRIDGSGLSSLAPGTWVQIVGEQKMKSNPLRLKRKAIAVIPVQPELEFTLRGAVPTDHCPGQAASRGELCRLTPPIKIGVCHKSSCCKRGATLVWKALEENLRHQGLEDQITLQRTKCLGKCKVGPAVLIMPGKTRYTEVKPKHVPTLVNQCLV